MNIGQYTVIEKFTFGVDNFRTTLIDFWKIYWKYAMTPIFRYFGVNVGQD